MAISFAKFMTTRIGKEFDYEGYRFRRAEREDEREVSYRLRHRVFGDEGFIEPSEFEEGLFRDSFDETSAHLIVYDERGQAIGTTRFVLPSAQGFPIEYLFEFERPPISRERLGEIGRLAILPEHRGGARTPMLGMIKMVYEVILEHDLTHFYAFMPPQLVDSYSAFGLVSRYLEVLPPTREILARRAPMRGYFARNEIRAVLFSVQEITEAVLGRGRSVALCGGRTADLLEERDI